MKAYVTIDKRQKKAQKDYFSKDRVMMGFNTGTRVEATKKHPSRAKAKADLRKEIER